ncbi:muscle-specific protein 20 [Toxorhynchites rutilus septentrionalis]|uniref:muscle-specific protein 20 n=1 Tax=Toxorhynchites rutilus septentrionalis TaxID=329112 RepID=UPI00247970E1|nr:muscle-specific protein 20 [Toxorhynchites rutilus septentrionalis]
MALERQVRAKIAGKRDLEKDKEAQRWIEEVMEEKFPAGVLYEDALRDGYILCKLINKLAPGSIAKINTSGTQFKMMENINMFQNAIKKYGVPDLDVFQTVDLYEKKDIAQVTSSIFALARACYKHPEFTGPYLGPKPSDECKRNFTEEQLNSGQTIIGLQAGTNKGATQAGQNIGAGRKIIIGK